MFRSSTGRMSIRYATADNLADLGFDLAGEPVASMVVPEVGTLDECLVVSGEDLAETADAIVWLASEAQLDAYGSAQTFDPRDGMAAVVWSGIPLSVDFQEQLLRAVGALVELDALVCKVLGA